VDPKTQKVFRNCKTCRDYQRDYMRNKVASAPEGTKYCPGGCRQHLAIAQFSGPDGRVYSRCLACRDRIQEKKSEVRENGTKYCGICNAYRGLTEFCGPEEGRVYDSCARCRGYQKDYQDQNKDGLKAKRQAKKCR
jgi:hypothetical protein